jgi:hypothetical protein
MGVRVYHRARSRDKGILPLSLPLTPSVSPSISISLSQSLSFSLYRIPGREGADGRWLNGSASPTSAFT